MKLLAFAASHRSESLNRMLLAQAVAHMERRAREEARADAPLSVSTIEYGALEMPLFNQDAAEHQDLPASARRVRTVFEAADGLLLASPEYNWSCPGTLKNIIDWMSVCRPVPLSEKPVFLMSASPSPRGGMMGMAHLKTILESVDMFVYPRMFGVGKAPALLSNDGISDPKLAAQLAQQLDGFVRFARRLSDIA